MMDFYHFALLTNTSANALMSLQTDLMLRRSNVCHFLLSFLFCSNTTKKHI